MDQVVGIFIQELFPARGEVQAGEWFTLPLSLSVTWMTVLSVPRSSALKHDVLSILNLQPKQPPPKHSSSKPENKKPFEKRKLLFMRCKNQQKSTQHLQRPKSCHELLTPFYYVGKGPLQDSNQAKSGVDLCHK